MFTGIVTEVGKISAVERSGDGLRFWVRATFSDLEIGESIAIGGACLTVVDCADDSFAVDAVVTTRGRTWFDEISEGDEVNLERALPIGERLGGHLVQGHVDAVGTITAVENEADATLVNVSVPAEVAEITVPHGSITIDGVSLTVNEILQPGLIQLALIPYTLQHTTLRKLKPGDRVHIEADMIGKFVRQLVNERQG